MNTLGWILILTAIIVIRAVFKGRVTNIPEDLSDGFLAIVQGDEAKLAEVAAREGEGLVTEPSTKTISPEIIKGNLALATKTLGEKAKGYKWAATGPDYYDCSGLMWRACQSIGYTGGRFTTATIRNNTSSFKVISRPGMQGPGVTAAGVNDIVLWPAGSGGITGHMGVISGPDTFYSARSVKTGIGDSKISTFRRTSPIYLRYIGPSSGLIKTPFKDRTVST